MSAPQTVLSEVPEMGLRELKKQMTHDSIADAAFQLTVENGLDNVTIEEIARVAFISPRTFSNYFSCKEEAVVAAGVDASHNLAEDFLQRPTDEQPLQSLCKVTSDFVSSQTREQLLRMTQRMALVQQYPALRPFETAQYDNLEEALRGAIAARTGTDLDTDMYPWLVAATAVSAIRSALKLWARSGAAAKHLPQLIQTAFNQISDGLPAPRA